MGATEGERDARDEGRDAAEATEQTSADEGRDGRGHRDRREPRPTRGRGADGRGTEAGAGRRSARPSVNRPPMDQDRLESLLSEVATKADLKALETRLTYILASLLGMFAIGVLLGIYMAW